MRELPGTNIVHKSDHDFNPSVKNVMKLETQVSDPKEFINLLGKAKKLEDVTKENEPKEMIIEETKENIQEEKEEER